MIEGNLVFNGEDRIQTFPGSYFNLLQIYQHWPNSAPDGLNMYSFCLNPTKHHSTGTCNFSRLSSVVLNIKVDDPTFKPGLPIVLPRGSGNIIHIYAINYNVARIMGGMAGLAYNN